MSLSSVARPITWKVFASVAPAGVERNGIRLPHLLTQNDFNSASLGWFYDGAAKFLYVKFPHSGIGATVTFGPDSVGDGIPDSWRTYYGITDDNADDDGDGFTNGEEYFAGTNPIDPNSRLSIASVTPQPNGFQVSWPSQLGILYRVQWKNDPLEPEWQAISPDFPGTGSIMSWVDDWLDINSQTGPPPGGKRFYRVTVP